MTNAVVRVPDLEEAEVVKLVNGPEAFTPDGEFILGETDVRGFWVASGFCAHGLAGAGGMGRLVAEWIVEGQPSLDTWEMDSRRFGRHYASREYTLARTLEVYQTYYDVKYPGHERQAGRPLRLSPTYERLQELGAAFGEKSGWERANWFEPNAEAGDETLRPRGWAGRLWSPAIGVEHRACRESGGALRRDLLREDRGARAGSGRLPRESLRQPGRAGRRCHHVHADAEPAGRDRVRLHRHPPLRGPLQDRHGHCLRPARPRLDPLPRARGRLRLRRGRDLAPGLPWPLGPARPRHPAAADRVRSIQRGLSVHAGAGDRRRARPLSRAARHLRGRARVGALLPDRVRSPPLGQDLGAGAGPRASSRAATRRSTRSGSRRAIGSGGPTSHPTRRHTRRGSGSRSSSTRATSSAARRF